MFTDADGEQIKVRLYPNPSHLEFVDPVVTGGARAEQTSHSGAKLEHNPELAVPLLLHGDAAFPGQGVVAETLNLQSLKGYSTGGTVHLITDNQVGFTTDPEEARSTPYACDMAKGFNVPDHPRQRRRRRRVHRGDQALDGLPRALGPRHRHRPDRIPPIRAQRDRRARLHAAEDGGPDQGSPAGLGGLCRAPRQGGRGGPGRGRGRGHASATASSRRSTRSWSRRWRRATYEEPTRRPRSAPASSTGPRAPRSTPPSPRSGCGP